MGTGGSGFDPERLILCERGYDITFEGVQDCLRLSTPFPIIEVSVCLLGGGGGEGRTGIKKALSCEARIE